MVTQKQRPEKSVSVWQPFKEIEEIDRRLGNVDRRPAWRTMWNHMPSEEMIWAPTVDVVEKADKFVVKVELPGVKENDIDVTITGDTLTISGEKESDSEVNKKGYYYSESSYGSFSRSVTIPSIVNVEKIAANCEKGVLEITLPKISDVKPKKVQVVAKKKGARDTIKTREPASTNK
jgi:HSP20 family protein